MVKAAEKSAVLSSELKSRRQAPWISHGPVGLPFACAGVKSLIMPRKCSPLRPCAAALIPSASTRTHAPTDQKKALLCIVACRNFGNIDLVQRTIAPKASARDQRRGGAVSSRRVVARHAMHRLVELGDIKQTAISGTAPLRPNAVFCSSHRGHYNRGDRFRTAPRGANGRTLPQQNAVRNPV